MHHNDNLCIKQKSISKNHDGFNEIIHMHVPLRNEGEQLKNVGNREISLYVCHLKPCFENTPTK